MGVKIKDSDSNTCWFVGSNYYIYTSNCSNEGDEYLFYTNELREIRSVKYNYMCVDTSYYENQYSALVTCRSYYYGGDHPETSVHQYTLTIETTECLSHLITMIA